MNPVRSQNMSVRCPNDPARREARRPRRGALPFAVLLAASLLWIQAARADEDLLRGPRRIVRSSAAVAEPAPAHRGILEKIATAPVLFYRRFLGPSWGRQCSYHPSCSEYALQAVHKHGAFLGSIMAFDRLQHESDEARYTSRIAAGGIIKVYDPLENNDYWWYRPDHPGPVPSAGPDGDRETMP